MHPPSHSYPFCQLQLTNNNARRVIWHRCLMHLFRNVSGSTPRAGLLDHRLSANVISWNIFITPLRMPLPIYVITSKGSHLSICSPTLTFIHLSNGVTPLKLVGSQGGEEGCLRPQGETSLQPQDNSSSLPASIKNCLHTDLPFPAPLSLSVLLI